MNSREMLNVDVCIVGAGPTGLLLGNVLKSMGVKYVILEKRPHVDVTHTNRDNWIPDARSTTIQPGILDIYNRLGMDVLTDPPIPEERRVFRLASRKIAKNGSFHIYSDFTMDSVSNTEGWVKHHHALSIPQHEIENRLKMMLCTAENKSLKESESPSRASGDQPILYQLAFQKYSYEPQRESKGRTNLVVTALSQTDAKTSQDMTISCRYLCGCDGGNSLVRQQSHIQFVRAPYSNFYYTVELNLLNFPFDLRTRHNFTPSFQCGPVYFLHVAHLGPNYFRLFLSTTSLLDLPKISPGQDTHSIVQQNRKKIVEQWLLALFISWKLQWIPKDLVRFNQYAPTEGWALQGQDSGGAVFLCGDAAHMHTPHGGQGLNTGALDAINLGTKLGLAVRLDLPQLTQGFNSEMVPVWREVVDNVGIIKAVHERTPGMGTLITDLGLPLLLPHKIRAVFARKIGKISIGFRTRLNPSPITRICDALVLGGVNVGDPAPCYGRVTVIAPNGSATSSTLEDVIKYSDVFSVDSKAPCNRTIAGLGFSVLFFPHVPAFDNKSKYFAQVGLASMLLLLLGIFHIGLLTIFGHGVPALYLQMLLLIGSITAIVTVAGPSSLANTRAQSGAESSLKNNIYEECSTSYQAAVEQLPRNARDLVRGFIVVPEGTNIDHVSSLSVLVDSSDIYHRFLPLQDRLPWFLYSKFNTKKQTVFLLRPDNICVYRGNSLPRNVFTNTTF